MKKLMTLILAFAILLCACSIQNVEETTAEPDTQAVTEAVTEAPAEPPTEPPTPAELAREYLDEILARDDTGSSAKVKVPEIYQYPELPTGCESVALTIVIKSFGYKLSKTKIAEKYLVYGDDYIKSFVGNPFAYGGAGIYPPGLVKTAKAYIKDTGADLCAFDITGTEFSDLYKLIDEGIPVVVWTTCYMNWPQLEGTREYKGHKYAWYDNEHCVCLYGYDKDQGIVRISDPQRGKISVSAYDFERIYDAVYRLAMVLIPTDIYSDSESSTETVTKAVTQVNTESGTETGTEKSTQVTESNTAAAEQRKK